MAEAKASAAGRFEVSAPDGLTGGTCSLVVSAVAVGWSGYAAGFLAGIGHPLPAALSAGAWAGGLVNLPAILIIGVAAALLMLGARESANVNAVLVLIKIAALGVFVWVAAPHVRAANFHPFMPY